VQKVDTAKASTSKVNSVFLLPEYLVHLVGISVTNRDGADLAQLTQAMGEDVCNTLDTFRRNFDNSMPRQIQSIVKEVMGNIEGKRVPDTATAPQNTPL
jgi:hypothetical protein